MEHAFQGALTGNRPVSKKPRSNKSGWERWRTPVLLLVVLLLLPILLDNLVLWPSTDEGDYLQQGRLVSQGKLPYRDYFQFITPGGQMLLGGVFSLLGFSVSGVRMLVLLGWVLESVLVFRMARHFLPPVWCWMVVGFLGITQISYMVMQHHFLSGLFAVVGVYAAFRYLESGNSRYLLGSGLAIGMVPWVTQSAGAILGLAMLGFSAWEAWQRMPDSRGAAGQYWLQSWGRCWVLPALGVTLGWVGWLWSQGLWPLFWRDSVLWLLDGRYSATTTVGYFVTLGSELHQVLKPLSSSLPWQAKLMFVPRVAYAAHMLLIALLPLLGLWGVLPRLLRQHDSGLTLLWVAGLALVLSTFSYSTSMHIASNGALAFLLGGIVVYLITQGVPRLQRFITLAWPVLLGGVLIAHAMGALMHLVIGFWLPPFPTLGLRMLMPDRQERVQQTMQVIDIMEQAAEQGRSVWILSQSPQLYLAGNYANATRFTLTMPHYLSQWQMEELITDLKANRPLVIVDDHLLRSIGEDPRFAHYPPETLRLPELERFIRQYYVPQKVMSDYTVYRRREG